MRADSVLIKVDKGQGTLGLLVNDPRLYHNTDSLMIDIRGLIADMKKNPKRYIKLSIFSVQIRIPLLPGRQHAPRGPAADACPA